MWERIRNSISEWFIQRKDRSTLINNFNQMTKMAFISGELPSLLKAKVSIGNSSYTHAFTKFAAGGFRIQAMSGRVLTKEEMSDLGSIILFNDSLVRELISLGFDTLELHSDVGNIGLQWQLTKYSNVGGLIN